MWICLGKRRADLHPSSAQSRRAVNQLRAHKQTKQQQKTETFFFSLIKKSSKATPFRRQLLTYLKYHRKLKYLQFSPYIVLSCSNAAAFTFWSRPFPLSLLIDDALFPIYFGLVWQGFDVKLTTLQVFSGTKNQFERPRYTKCDSSWTLLSQLDTAACWMEVEIVPCKYVWTY